MQVQLKKDGKGYLAICVNEPDIRAYGTTPLEAIEFLQGNYCIAKEIDQEQNNVVYNSSFQLQKSQLHSFFERVIGFKDLKLIV